MYLFSCVCAHQKPTHKCEIYEGIRCDHVKLTAWKSQIAARKNEDAANSLSQSLLLVCVAGTERKAVVAKDR